MNMRTRHFRRCRLETYVSFPDFPRRFDWEVVNLSPTGCQVTGNLPLRRGDTVSCELTVPEAALDIRLTCRVAWICADRHGLEFLALPPGVKLRLAMALYAKKAA